MGIRILLALFVVSSGVVGCKTHVPAVFNKGEGLQGKETLLVPFSELRHNRWYTESRRGNVLTRYIEDWVRVNSDHSLVEDEDIVSKIRDWPSNRITRANWKTILAGSELDYIVVGDLHESRLQSRDMIGMLDASATARYRVIEAKSGKTIYENDKLVVTLGGQKDEIEIPIREMGSDREAVERRLLATLGKAVGRELYGYTKD